jgi:hypothetical protein
VGQDGTNLVVAVIGPVLAGFENGFRQRLRGEISKAVPSNKKGEDVRGVVQDSNKEDKVDDQGVEKFNSGRWRRAGEAQNKDSI